MFLVDGIPANFKYELYDRIMTRTGLRLVHYSVFEPVNRQPYQSNLFVPVDETDRITRTEEEKSA